MSHFFAVPNLHVQVFGRNPNIMWSASKLKRGKANQQDFEVLFRYLVNLDFRLANKDVSVKQRSRLLDSLDILYVHLFEPIYADQIKCQEDLDHYEFISKELTKAVMIDMNKELLKILHPERKV